MGICHLKSAYSFLGVLFGCLVASQGANAVTWKLSSAVRADLQSWTGYPPDHPECTVQGVCTPYNTTIKNNTLWYWCGWNTKDRTEYTINSAAGSITALLMREDDLQGCALKQLSSIKSCITVDNSLCDTQTRCSVKVYGFSFADPMCLLVANNDQAPAPVTIQMWQYYDSRRYYGTVFSLLLLILILGAALGNVAYTCFHQCRKPNHRLDELERMTRAKLAATAAPVSDADAATADASETMVVSSMTTKRQATLTRPSSGAGGSTPAREGDASGSRPSVVVGLTARSGGSPPLMDRVKAVVGMGQDSMLGKGGHNH